MLLALFTGCARKKKPVIGAVPSAPSSAPRIGTVEEGVASWYGDPYHGRAAANGEIYDMERLTAAHRTLPFGTWVRVDNLTNGKDVTVRINDRGPFVDQRIIDLSRAAARKIEMLGPGTARVRLTVTARPADAPRDDFYRVQVGVFRDRARAEEMTAKAGSRFGGSEIVREASRPLYIVVVGPRLSLDDANALAKRVRNEFGPAVVIRSESE